MRIGELARRAEVPIETIRFHEREGVIASRRRRRSGDRDDADVDVRRLRFVRRARRLGFSLAETHRSPGLDEHRGGDMTILGDQAQPRLDDIDHRIDASQRIRRAWRSLLNACPDRGPLHACPTPHALSKDAP